MSGNFEKTSGDSDSPSTPSVEQKITVIDYDETKVQDEEIRDVEECFPFKDEPTVTRINVDGLQPSRVPERIGEHFGLHPLVMEDILNTGQRPKIEDFDDYVFVILKMLSYDKETDEIDIEQVSLILGSNFVISFQEKTGDVFEPVRTRIRSGKGRIRKKGSDYLFYALLDGLRAEQ